MRSSFVLLLLVACGSPEPAQAPTSPPPTSPAPTTPTPAPAPRADALDPSSPEATRKTLIEVLKRGDKDAFKACITRRILTRREKNNDFDPWFEVWKSAAVDNPSSFSNIRISEEDGKWKLDEN